MKQRIDIPQLQQLTPSQQEKLREWWKPKEGDYVLYRNEEYLIVHKNQYGIWLSQNDRDTFDFPLSDVAETSLPLLSIGQCIELLFEQNAFREYPAKESEIIWICGYDKGWLSVDWSERNQGELIDALWEAVKSIL